MHPANRGHRVLALAIGIFLSVLGLAARAESKDTNKSTPKDVPAYKVDPFWPKPLPHKWILQGIPVLVTDKDDHIWAISRPDDIKPDESGASNTPHATDC